MSLNKINKVKFLNEIDKYREITRGHGREIADRAGVSYTRLQNYIKGAGNNPEIMESIIDAYKELSAELMDRYQDALLNE